MRVNITPVISPNMCEKLQLFLCILGFDMIGYFVLSTSTVHDLIYDDP